MAVFGIEVDERNGDDSCVHRAGYVEDVAGDLEIARKGLCLHPNC